MTQGILGWGTYLPYRRLDRTTIAAVAGEGGGRGHRTVASYDEDTTTMAVEAARRALRSTPGAGARPGSVWFATTAPAYSDKTNATGIHAALRLPADAPAYDLSGAVRSTIGALRAGLTTSSPGSPSLVVGADIRIGLPGSGDESGGGDAGAAFVVGHDADGPVLAKLVGQASTTAEFLDRWRAPGEHRSRLWEERFGERRYVELGLEAWRAALKASNIDTTDVDRIVVNGTHSRAVSVVADRISKEASATVEDLRGEVGETGAAHPLLGLAAALESSQPGDLIAQVSLADGADVLIWRTMSPLPNKSEASVSSQVASGGPIPYGKYLAWRGWLPLEPPRRPEPMRTSAAAAGRSLDWKYGFVGSQDSDGEIHLPPSPLDDLDKPMAEMAGAIVTFTIDRLAYSPSPPIVFAIVDFEGGGRLPVELTDVEPDEVCIGMPVEMTFRRLYTSDGIHNYFWKARPVRRPS
jgi:hydroxymethylglutaryl-CoA synthase